MATFQHWRALKFLTFQTEKNTLRMRVSLNCLNGAKNTRDRWAKGIATMTKRETLSDDKARIEKLNDRIQLYNNFKADLKDEDVLLILKTLIDLLEGAINGSRKE